jgi:penicillin-binding protein 1A
MTLRAATEHSVNAAFANLTMKVGAKAVADTAKEMGIQTPLDPYPSIGIGGLTIGVSPLEMASAYGTLANGGVYVEPVAINKIVDGDGKVIKVVKPKSKKVLDPQIAYRAVDILRGVITRGTATRANIGRPAAGKTGTNQAYRDAWFVGFTPNLSTAVWMGHPQAQISMYNVHGGRAYGGHIPAKIWQQYMKRTLKGTTYLDFPKAKWPKGGGGYYKGSGRYYYQAGNYKYKSRSYYRSRRTNNNRGSVQSNSGQSTSSSKQEGAQGNKESDTQAQQAPQENGSGGSGGRVVVPQSSPPQSSPQVQSPQAQSVPDEEPAYGRRNQTERIIIDD